MRDLVLLTIGLVQLSLAKASFFICSLFFKKTKRRGWVVVGVETALMLKNISSALPYSISVNFESNKFYNRSYTFQLYSKSIIQKAIVTFYSPMLLGYLMTRHDRFLYLGAAGFIKQRSDGRRKEFKFLKTRNKKLVCYFLGSEIRSFTLLNDYAKVHQIDVVTTYQGISHAGINSTQRELNRKTLGEVADEYADKIFNPSTDQMSYIKQETFPCMYFLESSLFECIKNKFESVEEIVVLHGPSSPIIKGTPIVRAAIKKLKEEGYQFKYIELIDVPHDLMLQALSSAHIVLNEFYAFVPGVFGVEALAHSCALLTSADSNIEPTLSEGANNAWKVTPYWSVYDNLKVFLDNPHMIEQQAKAGYEWALKNCTYEASVAELNRIVND